MPRPIESGLGDARERRFPVNRRNILKLALSAPLLASGRAWGQAKTVTLWYPAGDITAGAAHFSDKGFFAPFEAKTGIKVEGVGLDFGGT
jgi:hypothetical protein